MGIVLIYYFIGGNMKKKRSTIELGVILLVIYALVVIFSLVESQLQYERNVTFNFNSYYIKSLGMALIIFTFIGLLITMYGSSINRNNMIIPTIVLVIGFIFSYLPIFEMLGMEFLPSIFASEIATKIFTGRIIFYIPPILVGATIYGLLNNKN